MEEVKEEKIGYKSLINERNYLLETLSSIISRFGDGIDTIAFSLLVYQITGSTLLVATLFAVNGLPNLIFGMISGVLCKYVTDKKIMAICDFGRGICVSLIAILFITGNLATWHLYVITFLNSSFESFRGPAATSIIPKLLPMEKIEYGTAFSSAGTKVTELIGLAAAPFLIGMFGLGSAIIVDAATFIMCGLLILGIRLEEALSTDDKLTVKSYFIDLKEGFRYVKNDGLILNIIVFAAVINALFTPYNALQAPYVEEVLHTGSSAMSVMSIAILLGMTVSTVFAPKIKEKIGGRNMFVIGGVMFGITYFSLAFFGNLTPAGIYISLAVASFIGGVGILLVNFPLQVILLKNVPQEYLPRAAAIMMAGTLCAAPIGSCITGVVSQFISIEMIYLVVGVITSILFLLQYFNNNIKKFNED